MIDRIAAAPISWGICEVPGWGLQMAPSRVLGEMAALEISQTELGALGWLPDDVDELHALLDQFHIGVLGGFVPLVLHHGPSHPGSVEAAHAAASTLAGAGGRYFVAAVISSMESWDRPTLNSAEWSALFEGLAETEKIAAEYGLTQVVHPHVNTLIETAAEFERFLANSASLFCLDTGHLFIGDADPVAIAEQQGDRVGLVHVKDVDRSVAGRFRAGEFDWMGAIQHGLFPSAGEGDAPIADTVRILERSGYAGWYVLEQDVALTDGEPPLGEGPVHGVRKSIEYLKSLAG
ncbi:MAG TPA: sugar phosphate isomerase/epimerase [Ilumatobacteraceae bacterium]|nr:sugar phosphate isomerase/epimerase [Ilumatobacteraceae bacterium]